MIDLLNRRKLAVRVYVVVQRSYRHIAGGQYQIRAVDGPHDVHQAELMRFKFERVRIHHDLPVTAAEGLRHTRAGNTRHLIAHRELRQVPHLSFVKTFTADRDQTNRKTRGIEFQNNRRQCAGREPSQLRHCEI